MDTIGTYLADRFARHANVPEGRWRTTLDDVLLFHIHKDLSKDQRIELPLTHVREDLIRSYPLLTAFSTDDEVYVRETIKDAVAAAFSSEHYYTGPLVEETLARFGSRNARLIKRLSERLDAEGSLSGPRFYLDAFETSYRMQFEMVDQRDDIGTLERATRTIRGSGDRAPMNALTSTFKRPDPLLNWVHDALIDYHEFTYLTTIFSRRDRGDLSANSYSYLSDHFGRKAISSLLSAITIRVSPALEKELFPGDEVAPLSA